MSHIDHRIRVGELRPSQLMHTFGIGAIIDLPHISALVMGLDDWDKYRAAEIVEERLLTAVRASLGPQVERLVAPPMPPEADYVAFSVQDENSKIGVPLVPFPRWMHCPFCHTLAPLKSGLFKLKTDRYRIDRTRYEHHVCQKADSPKALPARFMAACENGHLDDFPWVEFSHFGKPVCDRPMLKLREFGVTGEAAEIEVSCTNCGAVQRMARAFGDEAKKVMPTCSGRRPHLRDREEGGCVLQLKTMALGASNAWFPVKHTAVAIPVEGDSLAKRVDENWGVLKDVDDVAVIKYLHKQGLLVDFNDIPDEQLLQAIKSRRERGFVGAGKPTDLKGPEWRVLSRPDPSRNSNDFQLREVDPPKKFAKLIDKVVLVERLREVSALIGFTRIESSIDFLGFDDSAMTKKVSLSRKPPTFVPAGEVRGEGIFLVFSEKKILKWSEGNLDLEEAFLRSHRQWSHARRIEKPDENYPGLRYVLLHSFSHALMRQLALESGYTAASIRERIYSRDADDEEPMAGVLLYTAAPDSDGTLGGLVRMGETDQLGRHLNEALVQMKLCTSDPLCAEHVPDPDGSTLHGAACHACLFAPETSCECGNKFLDRSVLVPTVHQDRYAFFDTGRR